MYRITKVRLHNICQYSEYEATIDAGLTAITAPNGSGKTNFLRAVVYGLTGMVDGLWGGQKTLQKDGTSAVGRVAVSFTDGVDEYTVTRFATSSVSFCDVVEKGSELVAKRRKAVDAFMEGVFGMSCRMMFMVCWGRQGELASLLCAPPAIVGDFLSGLFDTSCMEVLRGRIKTKLDEVATLDPSCRERRDACRKQLADLPSQDGLAGEVVALERAKEERDALMKALDEAVAAGGKYATSEARDRASARISEIDDTMNALQAKLAMLLCKPCEQLDGAGGVEDVESALSAAEGDRDNARARLQDTVLAVRDVNARISAATAELTSAKERRERLATHSATDKCVLCGTPIARQSMDDYVAGLASLLGLDDVDDAWIARMEDEVATLNGRLADLAGLSDKLTADIGGIDDRIRRLRSHHRWLVCSGIRKSIDSLSSERHAILSDLAQGEARIQQVSDMIRSLDASVGSGEGVEVALHKARAERYKAECMREVLSKSLSQYEKDVEQYECNNNVRETLSAIRDAFSSKRAQARYLDSRVDALNRHIARYMELTGMPFSLRLDKDSRMFVYLTSDGYEHPAAHLSGAQKSMSAVALQMAVFAVMSPSMNLYLIDEPTEALDAGNKEIMASMFARMSDMLPSVDGVMLIVTRDSEVVASCRSVMDISG